MRKLLTAFACAFAAVLILGGAAQAVTATTIGPFPGASPDSGTCGNNWANDTYQWSFTVGPLTAGKGTLTETFTGGRFTAVAGKSPGACETGSDDGGTVAAGVKGSFSGSETGELTGATMPTGTVTAPNCPAPQESFTTCRVKAIFGSDAVFTPSTFKFIYTADCGQALVMRTWQNADAASGGNTGDIKSAPGEASTVPCATPTPAATPSPTVRPVVLPQTGGANGDQLAVSLLLAAGLLIAGCGVLYFVRKRA